VELIGGNNRVARKTFPLLQINSCRCFAEGS
jgi:hypothetical protein